MEIPLVVALAGRLHSVLAADARGLEDIPDRRIKTRKLLHHGIAKVLEQKPSLQLVFGGVIDGFVERACQKIRPERVLPFLGIALPVHLRNDHVEPAKGFLMRIPHALREAADLDLVSQHVVIDQRELAGRQLAQSGPDIDIHGLHRAFEIAAVERINPAQEDIAVLADEMAHRHQRALVQSGLGLGQHQHHVAVGVLQSTLDERQEAECGAFLRSIDEPLVFCVC